MWLQSVLMDRELREARPVIAREARDWHAREAGVLAAPVGVIKARGEPGRRKLGDASLASCGVRIVVTFDNTDNSTGVHVSVFARRMESLQRNGVTHYRRSPTSPDRKNVVTQQGN
jgi:hypothetical protein